MRPVNRGNPTISLPDQSASQEWQEVVDRLAFLAEWKNQIYEKVPGLNTTGGKRSSDSGDKGDADLSLLQIRDKQDTLKNSYIAALTDKNQDADKIKQSALNLIASIVLEEDNLSNRQSSLSTRVTRQYQKYRNDLITNLGSFCSYCEMPMATSLSVEHMLPKSEFPAQAVIWNNFLLACPICNSNKGALPSRADGVMVAKQNGIVSPNNSQIELAALSTDLWPSDTINYTNWAHFFDYRLKRVIYGMEENTLGKVDIDPKVIRDWQSSNKTISILSDTGNSVQVALSQCLSKIAKKVSEVISTTTIFPELALAIKALPLSYQLNLANTQIIAPSSSTAPWLLQEVQSFQINTYQVKAPIISSVMGKAITEIGTLTVKQPRAFTRNLIRGVLPNELSDFLAQAPYYIDPFAQKVSLNKIDRTTYSLAVTKNLSVYGEGDQTIISSDQQFFVEAHVVSLKDKSSSASRILDSVGINRIDQTNNKVSDRRVAKRTRTWFLAFDAIQKLNTASVSSVDPALLSNLEDLIIQTAIATGFWTAWLSVFQHFLSPPKSTEMIARLFDVKNFPGTR